MQRACTENICIITRLNTRVLVLNTAFYTYVDSLRALVITKVVSFLGIADYRETFLRFTFSLFHVHTIWLENEPACFCLIVNWDSVSCRFELTCT